MWRKGCIVQLCRLGMGQIPNSFLRSQKVARGRPFSLCISSALCLLFLMHYCPPMGTSMRGSHYPSSLSLPHLRERPAMDARILDLAPFSTVPWMMLVVEQEEMNIRRTTKNISRHSTTTCIVTTAPYALMNSPRLLFDPGPTQPLLHLNTPL